MLRLYIAGISILVVAILLNVLVQKLGVTGWYEFLIRLSREGKQTFSALRWIDYAWLFVLYPFLLGLAAWLGNKLYQLLLP